MTAAVNQPPPQPPQPLSAAPPAQHLALIAAVPRNGAVGLHNALVFREPADLKHFRQVTMGCPVIMGRKTWDSLPPKFRPLPGRRNVVVSRNANFHAEGAVTAISLQAALAHVADASKVFVIGGAQLYALAIPLARSLVLTEVDADLPGDVFFPAWPRQQFVETSRSPQRSNAGLRYDFVVYEKR
jgi:dihydrofolate reductase